MLYAILGHDNESSLPARKRARADHLLRLQALVDEGRLLLAGPLPAIDSPEPGPAGFVGSLIVADFASLEAARAWVEADPYRDAGVYRTVDIFPFVQALP